MARTRWTDERIEDLAKVTYHNDGRLDEVTRMSEQTKFELEEMKRTAGIKARGRLEQAMIAAALASPAVTLIITLIHSH